MLFQMVDRTAGLSLMVRERSSGVPKLRRKISAVEAKKVGPVLKVRSSRPGSSPVAVSGVASSRRRVSPRTVGLTSSVPTELL